MTFVQYVNLVDVEVPSLWSGKREEQQLGLLFLQFFLFRKCLVKLSKLSYFGISITN